MLTMCPGCFELYSDNSSKPNCTCTDKAISVSVELVDIVKMLINLGFKVSYAYCRTEEDRSDNGKVTLIDIEFRALYPSSIFNELPPDWELTDSYPVLEDQVLGEPFTVLACECEHPPSECDPESVDFAKKVTISNLEVWLKSKDPEAYKAILILSVCG